MAKELIEHLLDNNLDEFKARFIRVLQQTPQIRAPIRKEFWIYFFLGSATTIQDQQLEGGSKIKDICFDVNEGNVLKLAFEVQGKVQDKVQDKVIIRYIEVVVDSQNSSNIGNSKIVTQGDLNEIKKILKIKQDVTKNDIQYIKINTKDDTVQVINIKLTESISKSTFKKINSGSESKGIDSALGSIATTRDVKEIKNQVEKFFEKLAKYMRTTNLFINQRKVHIMGLSMEHYD